ncbi:hypothetical protein NQ317_010278 [Molorchus minor]|uniref:Moesin/ezrin/radixin homolog 1 n=1 Tax=Molorchus minor TaxID=1323400 RepID=A0ABQ9J4T2_9CUCU|nr:hypothetical protein NQ317_010278 [Molorchus minor]
MNNVGKYASISTKKSGKSFPVKVCTLDAELEFNLEWRATGRDLFELVCRTIGLRETWYFGLQYEDSKGFISWLKLDKKVQDQSIQKNHQTASFMFLAKFYPEEVAEELVQEVTQHLFFLQFGDFYEDTYKPGMLASEDLLPQRVIDQYQMTLEMWEERIRVWYADHRGMSKWDEAEMEYLKDSTGPRHNKKETELWLGVTALGLNIYEKENKLQPKTTFTWSEIRHISFDDKKFIIKPVDKNAPNFVFFSQKVRMNKLILDLCMGNHDLFMRRRKPDSMELQQMKAAAKEENKDGRFREIVWPGRNNLREEAERERASMEQRLLQYQEEIRLANEALRRSEESADLLAEKSRVAEEEARILSQKASEAEKEIARLRLTAMRKDEEKVTLERKTREAEMLTARLVEESEKRAAEASKLKDELLKARAAEKQAKEKLLDFLSRTTSYNGSTYNGSDNGRHLYHPGYSPELAILDSDASTSPDFNLNVTSYDLIAHADADQLLEIEKNGKLKLVDYLEKSKHLQNQLLELRCEIAVLKVGDKQSDYDQLHDEQVKLGENKYSNLKKSKSGSTKKQSCIF